MKKWFVISAAAAAAAGALYLFIPQGNGSTPEEIRTAQVKRGDLKMEVVCRGTVTPDIEVIVKSKAGGEITGFPFNEGDIVKKGQTVVKLDPRTEETRANQARANVLMAEAKLERAGVALKDATTKHSRARDLFKDGIVSRQELDDAEISVEKARSEVGIAKAELLQSKESLTEALDRLADTEIKAPLAGTILKKFVDAGQVISSTISSASEGTQIFSMANLDRIYVKAQVDEVDVSRIRPGQEAAIAVDSLPGKVFSGKVERVAPQGKIERTVTVFDVTVIVTGSEKSVLRPGMTSDVRILTDTIKGALLLPAEAIKTKDGKTGVYVITGAGPDFIPVKTGKSDGAATVVTEGLDEGATVVVSQIKGAEKKKKKSFLP